MFSSACLPIYHYVYVKSILKKQQNRNQSVDVKKEHFKEGLATFLRNGINLKNCIGFSIFVNEN